MKKILSIIILILMTAGITGAEDKLKKEKLVMYYFQDDSSSDKYSYYSTIIPNSINSEIKKRKKTGSLDIELKKSVFKFISASAMENVFDEHIRSLANKAKEISADYLIIGAYEVKKNKIKINTQFFDAAFSQVIYMKEVSARQQAVFVNIIAKITKRIEFEIQESIDRKVK